MNLQGVLLLFLVLVVVSGFGYWWSKRNGQFKQRGTDTVSDDSALSFTEEQLGQPLGSQLTVVQFSSTFCQPCVATKRVISRSLDMVQVTGISAIEINADENLELTRQASIMRTPTVLLLDAAGREISRASGELRPPQFIGALGAALGEDLDVRVDGS